MRDERGAVTFHRPDLREKVFFFISGIIISVPLTIFVERFAENLSINLPRIHALLWMTILVAPLIEEFAKAYPLFYRHGETGRSIFILGFLVGLGFGFSEFLVYVFVLEAPVFLRVFGLFFHAASTSIVAYGISTKQTMLFYLTAVGLHFLNNLYALLGQFWFIGGAAAIAITYFFSMYLYRKTSENVVT